MDVYAFIFVAVLLAIGVVLILFVRSGRWEAPDAPGRSLRQEALREERRMQRRRWRVWYKIDELHDLFNERVAAAERMLTELPPITTRAESAGREKAQGESDFIIPDLQTAYETFLREDFLKGSPEPAAQRE